MQANPVTTNTNVHGMNGNGQTPRVVVCAKKNTAATTIMPHAKALAEALFAELVLVHVIEPEHSPHAPPDPLEWDLRHREAEAFVSGLSKEYGLNESLVNVSVLQGLASEQICTCTAQKHDDIAVLCRSDENAPGHIGSTARSVLENAGNSVMVIPALASPSREVKYRRILVPLDGSVQAEGALPMAMKIAQYHDAEIILVLAVPPPFLIQTGPLEIEDIALSDKLVHRNEQSGRLYLKRIRERIQSGGINVSATVLTDGDVRYQLATAIVNESVDLVLHSSHGNGGHASLPVGDTAIFLLAHSPVPVLMVRLASDQGGNSHIHSATQCRGLRRPIGAN